jgi:hypothetical protein
MTVDDIDTEKEDFEMKVKDSSVRITEANSWGTKIFKEPPYQGNLGSWFTKISLNMDNIWGDSFGTEAELPDYLPSPTDSSLFVTYKAGMVARIGNFNSRGSSTRKPLYRNKTWYIQDSARINSSYEYNKRLLIDTTDKDLKPDSYLSSISLTGDITDATDLKKLKITATYADGDTRTISYSDNFYIGNSLQGVKTNKGCGINGFYFTDTIEGLSADNAYKISVLKAKKTNEYVNYDSETVLTNFKNTSAVKNGIDVIYLVYAEKGYVNNTIKTCYYYITLTRSADGTIIVS